MTTDNEQVTQLHDRITITLSAELTKAVRHQAKESGDKVETVIDKGLIFYLEIEDDARNYDYVRVRKTGK